MDKALKQCTALQNILKKMYPSNDVIVILTLDNNKIYVEEVQKNGDKSHNPQSRIRFKCGLKYDIYKFTPVKMDLTKKNKDILNHWLSHKYRKEGKCTEISEEEVSKLIEQTGLSKQYINKYIEFRKENPTFFEIDRDTFIFYTPVDIKVRYLSKHKKLKLDKWYLQNCLPGTEKHSGITISDEKLSELIALTGLPKKTIMKYMKLREEKPLYDEMERQNQGHKCTFTSESLIKLLRHQNEEHNLASIDKPMPNLDATDAKIPRITTNDPVDDDNDIDLTQTQEEESPEKPVDPISTEVAVEVGPILAPPKMKLS